MPKNIYKNREKNEGDKIVAKMKRRFNGGVDN